MSILDIHYRTSEETEGFWAFLVSLFSCFVHVDPRPITKQERRIGRTIAHF
jgi:hypothetical protein